MKFSLIRKKADDPLLIQVSNTETIESRKRVHWRHLGGPEAEGPGVQRVGGLSRGRKNVRRKRDMRAHSNERIFSIAESQESTRVPQRTFEHVGTGRTIDFAHCRARSQHEHAVRSASCPPTSIRHSETMQDFGLLFRNESLESLSNESQSASDDLIFGIRQIDEVAAKHPLAIKPELQRKLSCQAEVIIPLL